MRIYTIVIISSAIFSQTACQITQIKFIILSDTFYQTESQPVYNRLFNIIIAFYHSKNGEGGIRTRGEVSPTQTFQVCTLNHSDTSPYI